jgi:hypothetical protein
VVIAAFVTPCRLDHFLEQHLLFFSITVQFDAQDCMQVSYIDIDAAQVLTEFGLETDCSDKTNIIREFQKCSSDGVTTLGTCETGTVCARKSKWYGGCLKVKEVAKRVDESGWEGTILSPETCSVRRVNATRCGETKACLGSYVQCSNDGVTTTGACCTEGDKCFRKNDHSGMCVGQERVNDLKTNDGWDGTVISESKCETFFSPGLVCDNFHCIRTGARCSDDGISMLGTCCNPGDVCMAIAGYGACTPQQQILKQKAVGWTQLADEGCRLVRPTTCNAFWDFRARDPSDHSQMEATNLFKVHPAAPSEYASVDLHAATMGAKLTLYAKADRAHGNADPRYVPLQFIPVPWQPAQISLIGIDPAQGIVVAGTGGGDPVLVRGINLAPSSHASCTFVDAYSGYGPDSPSVIQIRVNDTQGWSSVEATRYTSAHGICPIAVFSEPGMVNATALNNPASHTAVDSWPVQVQNAAVVLRGGQAPDDSPRVVQHRMFLSVDKDTYRAHLSCPSGLAFSSVEFADWGHPNATCHSMTTSAPGEDLGTCIEGNSSLAYADPASLISGTRLCTSVNSLGYVFAQSNVTVLPQDDPCNSVRIGDLFGDNCNVRGNECVDFAANTSCTLEAKSSDAAVNHLLETCKDKPECTIDLDYFKALKSSGCSTEEVLKTRRWLAVQYTCTAEWLTQDHIYGRDALAKHALNETGYTWAIWVKPAAAPLGSSQTVVAIESSVGSALNFRSGLLWSMLSRDCEHGYSECGTLAYYDACINAAPTTDSTGQITLVVAGSWTHVAVAVSPEGDGSVYLNGTLATRFTTKCLPDTKSSLFLGADHNGLHGISQNYFAGSLDEFKLWSEQQPVERFWTNETCTSAKPSSDDHLIVHYTMSASTGTKIRMNAICTQMKQVIWVSNKSVSRYKDIAMYVTFATLPSHKEISLHVHVCMLTKKLGRQASE